MQGQLAITDTRTALGEHSHPITSGSSRWSLTPHISVSLQNHPRLHGQWKPLNMGVLCMILMFCSAGSKA